MDRWEIASPNERLVWESVIGWLVDWQNAEATSKALTQAQCHTGLIPSLESQREAVRFHLENEGREREEQATRKQKCKRDRTAQIQDLLKRAATETRAFSELLYAL